MATFSALVLFILLSSQSLCAFKSPPPSSSLPVFNVLVTGFGPFLSYTDNPSGDIAVALNGTCIRFNDLLVDETSGGPQKDSFIVCFEGWLLPVNETGSTAVSQYLQKSSPSVSDWAAIVHLGLENSSLGLKIETVGANILASNNSKPAVPGAPSLFPTTADLSLLSIPELLYLPYSSDLVWMDEEKIFSQKDSNTMCADGNACSKQQSIIEKVVRKTKLTRKEAEEIGTEVWSRDAGGYYCNETFFRTLNVVRSKETQVSPSACTISGPNGKISSRRRRNDPRQSSQIQQNCWATPPYGMVPVEFVHVPDPSNVELETSIQLVARVAAFLVLPNALKI